MSDRIKLGRQGQQAAEGYLTAQGWKILERNYRVKTGEIDLIGQDGAYTVFVEVKTRSQLRFGYPRESVNPLKQHRIKKTALHYIAAKKITDRDFRFDVVEVLNRQGEWLVSHIKDAFQ